MSADADQSQELAARVARAAEQRTPLAIQAGSTKTFLGEPGEGEPLDLSSHRGVVRYEPGELILTARAGTPLTEIEAVLAEENQMLAFEPPHYGANATLGGTVATGVSGPARPFAGAARDFVLGARVINGRGEVLSFGGEVMKNVAGYDLSRLMAGAFGTLGVLLDISLKVLPVPKVESTRVFEHDAARALEQFKDWGRKPWPITAAYWENGATYLRLAGAGASVESAAQALGGEPLDDSAGFWRDVREHERAFFNDARALWRVATAPAAPVLDLGDAKADEHAGEHEWALDWGGAQRWLLSDAPAESIRAAVAEHGGHASVYRGEATPRLHPVPETLMRLHRRVKQSIDPERVLNRGRLYSDL